MDGVTGDSRHSGPTGNAYATGPAGTTAYPADTTAYPVDNTAAPAGNTTAPTGNTRVLGGTAAIPAGNTTGPAGTARVPAGTTAAPAGHVASAMDPRVGPDQGRSNQLGGATTGSGYGPAPGASTGVTPGTMCNEPGGLGPHRVMLEK